MDKFNDDMLFAINYRLELKKIPIVIDYETETHKEFCTIKLASKDYEKWLDRPILNPKKELIQVIRDLFKEMYHKELNFNNTGTSFWMRNIEGE